MAKNDDSVDAMLSILNIKDGACVGSDGNVFVEHFVKHLDLDEKTVNILRSHFPAIGPDTTGVLIRGFISSDRRKHVDSIDIYSSRGHAMSTMQLDVPLDWTEVEHQILVSTKAGRILFGGTDGDSR